MCVNAESWGGRDLVAVVPLQSSKAEKVEPLPSGRGAFLRKVGSGRVWRASSAPAAGSAETF